MTTTNTSDTVATVNQVKELADAGCELVRIAARNNSEAENLRNIRAQLFKMGCQVPLIADIHFQPFAAEIAARIVCKVRINPGNFVPSRRNALIGTDYTDSEYYEELEKIRKKLLPLINTCKDYGTAIRVGVNHGSLSDRITSRYGDTPDGMVASALEYIEMFAGEGFHNLVLSMKSSNVKTMIYSYRLLTVRMMERGYNYPLHLGVTEAGAGNDARVKSSAGIGELLMEGIGDTLRVSLTENPLNEIEVARRLRDDFAAYRNPSADTFHRGYSYDKTETVSVKNIGSQHPPVTIAANQAFVSDSRYTPDYYFNARQKCLQTADNADTIPVVVMTGSSTSIKSGNGSVIMYDISRNNDLHVARKQIFSLVNSGNKLSVVLYKKYEDVSIEQLLVRASAEFAFFLTDGLLNGICIDAPQHQPHLSELMFTILQAMGLRRVKAEFIACPTCSRTLYSVEGVLGKISARLSHLKHLKIGVMGCIVNGPGEMSDADYGYVGSGNKKVNLYKGKTLVQKNIDEAVALDELIRIIKENGDWVENGK